MADLNVWRHADFKNAHWSSAVKKCHIHWAVADENKCNLSDVFRSNFHTLTDYDLNFYVATIVYGIYIIISKNIHYLLWDWGLWRSLNNTYPIFLNPCIRCTNYLCDSCALTDVNPHFIPPLFRMIQNVDLLWRHRYKSRSPAIVTSQWRIVPAWLLWTLS